jgi:hypothetical protein
MEAYELQVSENRMLKEIFGSKNCPGNEQFVIIHNEEL